MGLGVDASRSSQCGATIGERRQEPDAVLWRAGVVQSAACSCRGLTALDLQLYPTQAPPMSKVSMDRNADLVRFYAFRPPAGEGVRACCLADCSGRMNWPRRGVYFFYEIGEICSDSGTGLRVVRIGTHALKPNAKSTLWGRLRQHRGGGAGGGNHRGSIFRLIVGTALVSQEPELTVSTWSVGSTADRATREGEHALECRVSAIIRAMPFVWLGINDDPGAESLRGYIERNAIALSAITSVLRSILHPPGG